MLDNLRKIFIHTLKCGDRVFTLSDKRFDIIDNVLQFTFDIRYTEETLNEFEEEYETAIDLSIDFE